MDGDEDHRVLANPNYNNKDSGRPTAGDRIMASKWYGVDIGVKGSGFINKKLIGTQGEYAYIRFRTEEEVTRSDTRTCYGLLQIMLERKLIR